MVSIGDSRIAERAEEIHVRIRVAVGDVDVRMSGAVCDRTSSGRAKIAERRLRIKVLSVGSSKE